MDSLKNKRILVTGGNGYLGKHLLKTLKVYSNNVFVIDNNIINENSFNFKIDITDREKVNEIINVIKPEIVFHLAAILNRERSFDDHDKILKINYYGTLNLLLAMKNYEYDNFIFTSSSEIYGDNLAPFNELQNPNPASLYSLSKAFSEMAIRTFSENYDKNFTILRLFNFFGEDMPESFFIPQLINSLKYKPTFNMTQGEQLRDFLYIDDVVTAMLLTAVNHAAKKKIYNVCSGQSITLKEIAEYIYDLLKSKCQINFGAIPYRKNEVWNMVGDNTKIKNELGFIAKNNFKEALMKTIKSNII